MANLSVLIVDDYEPDRRYASIMLERSGAFTTVEWATSAEEALARCRAVPTAGPLDLILVDINMPGMNGFDFLEAYLELVGADVGRAPAVAMLTSSDDPRDQARAAETQVVTDFVQKPLRVEDARALAAKIASREGPGAKTSAPRAVQSSTSRS